MFSYPTNTDIPKHNIHLFPFISLQRDDHSCWNFCCDLLRSIWFGAFQNRRSFGHLLFGFRFPGEIVDLADPEGRSTHFRESWIMIRYAGCFGIMMDFFKQPRASVQIKAGLSVNFWSSFDRIGRLCLLPCPCIILTWNPIDYRCLPLLLVVHQRIYCFGISSLCL